MGDGGALVGLGVGDVLTVTTAAKALHMREVDARAWLEKRGLVLRVAGRERVIWGDVLVAMRRGDDLSGPVAAPRPHATLRRSSRVV